MNGNKVKKFREANAWSIAELARKAGIVPQTVSKMEKNASTSRNSQLKVAKALDKKYEEVFPMGIQQLAGTLTARIF